MTKGCTNAVRCDLCINKDHSLFSDLEESYRNQIESAKVDCFYKKDEIIFKEGMKPTGLICLNQGKVKIYKEGIGGKDQIIRMVKAVELFGYRALFANQAYNSTAQAIEDSVVCHIDKDAVFDVLSKDPYLASKIIKRLANELGETKTRIVNLTQKHVRGRLAEALLILYDTYGTDPEDNYIDVMLGRNDLANLSNMTTSNASRTLSSFAEEKLIDIKGRKIRITDMDKLRSISSYG